MISETDEAALSWYFGPGLTIYERSTFGSLLAKLVNDSATSEVCKRCSGAGILDGAGGFAVTKACETCGGCGKAPNGRTLCPACGGFGVGEARRQNAERGGWCPSCNGTGATPVEEGKRRRTRCTVCCAPHDGTGKRKRRKGQAACGHCLGTGEEPVSAKQMQKGQEGGGVQADETALTRFAVISRRVARLRAVSPTFVDALAAWYGDKGQACVEEDESRSSLLYPLTEDGRAYLLAVEDRHSSGLEALKAEADERSAELIIAATRAWRLMSGQQRDRADLERLAGSLERLGYAELAGRLLEASA